MNKLALEAASAAAKKFFNTDTWSGVSTLTTTGWELRVAS
jgi:hypothetical protein